MQKRVNEKTAENSAQHAPDDAVSRFEDAMQELESIVQKMERGDLKLEDSLKLFERGMALTQQCRSSLDAAELKVKNLLDAHGATPATDDDA